MLREFRLSEALERLLVVEQLTMLPSGHQTAQAVSIVNDPVVPAEGPIWSIPIETDPLSQFLEQLQVRCRIRGELSLSPGQPFNIPATPGFGMILADGLSWSNGDVAPRLIPKGTMLFWSLGTEPGAVVESQSTELIDQRPAVDRDEPPRVLLGEIESAGSGLSVLTGELPRLVEIPPSVVGHSSDEGLLKILKAEFDKDRDGMLPIVEQLLSVLVLQVLRDQLTRITMPQPGWLATFHDPDLGPIISQMIQQPGRHWTVDGLAQISSLARSTFARRFREICGQTPMEVLTIIRMRSAALGMQSIKPMKEVARNAGYRSLAGFAAAFERWSGMSPQAYRRAHQRNGR